MLLCGREVYLQQTSCHSLTYHASSYQQQNRNLDFLRTNTAILYPLIIHSSIHFPLHLWLSNQHCSQLHQHRASKNQNLCCVCLMHMQSTIQQDRRLPNRQNFVNPYPYIQSTKINISYLCVHVDTSKSQVSHSVDCASINSPGALCLFLLHPYNP